MQNINRVILTGNLTRDPELKQTASGLSICSLRLAVNGRVKQGNEWVDKPNYFDVTVFGGQGENVARYLSKGKGAAIDGRLDWREWQTDDGQKRQAVQVIADSVQFLSDGSGGGGGGDGGSQASASAPASPPADDDIPF